MRLKTLVQPSGLGRLFFLDCRGIIVFVSAARQFDDISLAESMRTNGECLWKVRSNYEESIFHSKMHTASQETGLSSQVAKRW